MKRPLAIILCGTALLCAGTIAAAPKKPVAATPAPAPKPVAGPQPKARYAMDIGTTSGLAGMAGGGMGGAMSMMFGRGGREAHELRLRLGSTLSATGAPVADHFFQPAAKLGKSVPLVSPVRSEPQEPGQPRDFQRPKGRLLLFWGCGTHAPKGQPVIIDFAKIGASQPMPNLYSARIPVDRGPASTNSRTYGEWPNAKSAKQPQSGSLLGNHRISSTYAPEIQFALTQDYLAALTGQTAPATDGAFTLSWNSVPTATGYYAWVMGMKMDGSGADGPRDMVWWSSSSGREFGGGLFEWLSPAVVQQLIADRTVMPPSQTSCTVPAEVKAAAPDFMLGNLYAYGPETNIAYPPKPASGPWSPEWTARIRYRSTTSWMIGGPMAQSGPGNPEKRCKPGIFGAVTGLDC